MGEPMKTIPERTYEVRVRLPVEAFRHHPWQPSAIAEKMRLLWLVELVRERRLAYGKAADLAEMTKADFVRLMATHRVSPVDYDPDQLERELQAAADLGQA